MNGLSVAEAATVARQVLSDCAGPDGFRASALSGGYRQVWARDSMICLLGACAAGLEEFIPSMRASLETLTRGQTSLGYVPIYVDPEGGRDQGDPGGIDNNLWYLLGHYVLHRTFPIEDLLDKHQDALISAVTWLRYQDSDDDGLIEVQEAADWADLLAYRGKTLYGNTLYVLAARAFAELGRELSLSEADEYDEVAARATARLNDLHWVASPLGLWEQAPSLVTEPHAETIRIKQLTASELWFRPYYLPWVGFRNYGDWCDVLGNSLVILAGIADVTKRRHILDYFDQVDVWGPMPARALHPPIQPGDEHWRRYYRNGNLCLPNQYHNGGCWPMTGGLAIAALMKDGRQPEAESQLLRLAAAAQGPSPEWTFNEWYHGVTGKPMGKPQQAWSAAMYLLAESLVTQRQPLDLLPAADSRQAIGNLADQSKTGLDQRGTK